MEVPLLPSARGAVLATFALALPGWWTASRVERRRRTARRVAETNRRWEQPGGARCPPRQPRAGQALLRSRTDRDPAPGALGACAPPARPPGPQGREGAGGRTQAGHDVAASADQLDPDARFQQVASPRPVDEDDLDALVRVTVPQDC